MDRVRGSFEEGSSVVHDEASGFTLDVSGFGEDVQQVAAKFGLSLQAALEKIDRMEGGEVVNHTAVKAESEDRSVDHYNLRLAEERVPGKSLDHSLAQWNTVREAIDDIRRAGHFKDVLFNGIGGSYLGPLMIVVGILGVDFNLRKDMDFHLHFVSNTDPEGFQDVLNKVDLKTTLLVNMSKSGSTAETKGNMDTFNEHLQAAGLEPGLQNIAITTAGSPFDKYAQENKFLHIFHMFNETGGRTSVCSAIGMVPAAFAGLDFAEFLRGMSHMDELTRLPAADKNPAFVVASLIQNLTNRVGPRNMIVLGYHDHLREFSHYLQQLYMESLGKEYTVEGTQRPFGQTVFGGVGTGEQHAFMQQVQKGLRDCFVRFAHFRRRSVDFTNAKAGSVGRQLLAFVRGTQNALASNGVPYMDAIFEECNMFNWGMMVALEERIVSFLAIFNSVNAYDQPGVQDGKLAADEVNALSKKIESTLADWKAGQEWEGDAHTFAVDVLGEDARAVNLMNVEGILSDMEANLNIANAYTALANKLTVTRTFSNVRCRFVYAIAKL